jgi:hypothetical protein
MGLFGPTLEVKPVQRNELRITRLHISPETTDPASFDFDLAGRSADEERSLTTTLRAVCDAVPWAHPMGPFLDAVVSNAIHWDAQTVPTWVTVKRPNGGVF